MSFVKKLAGIFGKSEPAPAVGSMAPEGTGATEEIPPAGSGEAHASADAPAETPAAAIPACETLHACAETPGSAAQCRVLLERGANVLQGDVEGRTPLHVAAWHGNLAVLKVLCEEVISVDPYDDYRVSPLLFALRSPHPDAQEAGQYLITKGARLTLNVAFALGDLHLMNRIFLEDRKAYETCKAPEELLTDLTRAIRRACEAKPGGAEAEARVIDKYLPFVQRLVDGGLDPDAHGIAGRPPLFEAVRFQSTLLAETLLKLGADPNAISQEDETPLQVAGDGRPEMQALLREHGAT